MFILLILLLSSPIHSTFIDSSLCPLGWILSGEACIKLSLHSSTLQHAQAECERDGGTLLEWENDNFVHDVSDILNNLFDRGLTEPVWLVAPSTDENTKLALMRESSHKYSIVDVPISASYPFICSLTNIDRRSLLFQQQLLPRGAPHMSSMASSDMYYYTRDESHFLVLPCIADGIPSPTITWYRNHVQVVAPSIDKDSYLLSGGNLLLPSSPSLAYSTFHCTVSNQHGQVRGTSILLKPAFLESFRPTHDDVFPLIKGGARLDCQVPSHQPKSVGFTWLTDYSTEKHLIQDDRILVSLDGSLLFSYVIPKDNTSYACSLSLHSTQSGHYGPFFRLIVNTPQLTPFPPRIESSHPRIFPTSPIIGDTIYIECFAYGNPVPSYKWSRVDGKNLPNRANINNHGRILMIQKAVAADSGRYKCIAGNTQGSATAEISIIVRSPPDILIPLSDRLLPTSIDFSLDCPLSLADSQSSVEWFKDTKPIVPILMPSNQRKRYTVDHSKLFVRNSQEIDSGVYQCIVSNEVGVATSSALVIIKDVAPIFPSQAMPTKIYAAKGTTLTVPCIYQASPHGIGQWTDSGGRKLSSGGRIRSHRGSLIIENIQHDDTGLFFCTTENKKGKAHSQTQLIVVDRPQLRISPSPSSSSIDSTLNNTCEVEIDCRDISNCPDPLFQWSIDDIPIKTKEETKFHHHHMLKKSKEKQNTKIGSSHRGGSRLSCSSFFGSDAVEIITRPSPSPPIHLKAENVSSQSIKLSWKMTPQHREIRENGKDSSDGFLVEYRTRLDRRWRATMRNNIGSHDKDVIILDKLIPNMYYQFRLRSIDSTSVGEASIPSEWIQTAYASPYETIEGLKWRALDENTLLVEWDAIEKEHPTGENLRYRVSWSERSSTSSSDDSILPNYVESKSAQAIVRLNSTDGCRMVILAVRAMNNQGEGSSSTETIAFINSKGNLRSVEVIEAKVLNSSHANITWTWKGNDHCETTFAVQIECISPSDDKLTYSVSSEYNHWIVDGLDADTKYNCNIKPFDSKGTFGESSAVFDLFTMQRPPSSSPVIKKLSLKPSTDDSGYTTVLEWSSVPLGDNISSLTTAGYKILIYISETASEAVILEMPLSKLTEPERPTARLDGLRLMYMYTIQVAGYNQGGIGPLSEARSVRLGSPGTLDSHAFSSHFFISHIIILFLLLRIFW